MQGSRGKQGRPGEPGHKGPAVSQSRRLSYTPSVRYLITLLLNIWVCCAWKYLINGYVPCNLETLRSLQTAPCSLQTACHAVCRLRGHRFNELHARVCFGEITSKKTERIVRENCHDFIVLYCVRNWEGIPVVENLVGHNNRSFRANKLVIVSPNYKQENE